MIPEDSPFTLDDEVETITRFDPVSGKILGSIWGKADQLRRNKEMMDGPFLDGFYSPDSYYVLGEKAIARPSQPTKLHGLNLEDIPYPAKLIINGQEYVVTESSVELAFDQPGTYTVKLESWPYLDKEFTIENQTQ